DIAALDLVRDRGVPTTTSRGREPALAPAAPNDAGELLDGGPRDFYRRRTAELAEELAGAEANNDLGRVARLREEIELLTREFERAIGVGGRSQRAGAPGERARINVTRAIADTLRRIATHSPA